MANRDLEARLVLQKRQERDISNNDDTEPLHLAVQGQVYSLHGQVSDGIDCFTTKESLGSTGKRKTSIEIRWIAIVLGKS